MRPNCFAYVLAVSLAVAALMMYYRTVSENAQLPHLVRPQARASGRPQPHNLSSISTRPEHWRDPKKKDAALSQTPAVRPLIPIDESSSECNPPDMSRSLANASVYSSHGFWMCLRKGGWGGQAYFAAVGGTMPGHWEITLLFEHLLGDGCGDDIVIDVGMNSGFYTLLTASLGCPVMAFEIQRPYVQLVKKALRRNGWEKHACLRHSGVHERALPRASFEGGYGGAFLKPGLKGGFKTVLLDDVLLKEQNGRQVRLLKIDVEGLELNVLSSCLRAMQSGVIHNIVVEIGDGSRRWWPRAHKTKADAVRLFTKISEMGYDLRILRMTSQPSFPWFNRSSPKFDAVLGSWELGNTTVALTQHSAFVHDGPPPKFALQSGTPARRWFQWARAVNIEYLVDALLWKVDFNMWFHHKGATHTSDGGQPKQTSSIR